MGEALAAIKRWRDGGQAVALATVVATRRSAPRPLGSKLAVSEAGQLAGSVSGGCVESDVAIRAREVLESGRPKLLSYGIPDEDAWEVGLPCGGEIDVFVARVEGELPDPEIPQVIFTVVDGERAGERWVSDDDEVMRTQLLERDGERVFAEVLGPPPRLLIFGAVDLAEELCRAAQGLGWRTVVVLTHEDRWDVPALAGALGSDAFYVGALGSRRTQERRRAQLLESGISEEQLGRLNGPAGLDLGAGTPAETAVSIVAEILAVRAGREGGRLRSSSERIHA